MASIRNIKSLFWQSLAHIILFISGSSLLAIAFAAELLGIDSGGEWGILRITVSIAGFVLIVLSSSILSPYFRRFIFSRKAELIYQLLVKSAAWVLVALLITDFVLGIVGFKDKRFIVIDPVLGSVPTVGSSIFWTDEGRGYTQYIAPGEISTPYNDGIDILVLGDSQTECFQVKQNEKFTSVAEEQLHQNNLHLNLHNLSASGLSLASYAAVLPGLNNLYHPSLVVIQISVQDFNGVDGFTPKGWGAYFKRTDNDGYELITPTFQASAPHKETKYPLFGNLFENYYFKIKKMDKQARAQVQIVTFEESMDIQLEGLNKVVRDLDLKILILVLPDTPYIKNGNIVLDDPEFNLLLSKLSKYPDWEVINPQTEFNELAKTGNLPRGFNNTAPGSGHLNSIGNHIVGLILAEKIKAVMK